MCEQFTYGGCDGSANNFETKEQCVDICLSGGGDSQIVEPRVCTRIRDVHLRAQKLNIS